jgi:hypothetical protein
MGFDGHHHDPEALIPAVATTLGDIGAGRAKRDFVFIIRYELAMQASCQELPDLVSGQFPGQL